ncbi:ABC transporter ATP-binding protein [Fuerstiella marisgermanici]|uniref:Putative ABC transporter ATP-binding protein n=1 Tax=Fuerstiella marisgermanici TaxID=1891926 RepID=A0A1P8WKT5_9PLAN|nr:ABC transporter ATP-binding protein [Fuerstiella marisgermanici]APZ94651.1 putative ABC transporter ATP-binding protein [Fuerstiella marisgermanici]
MIAISNLNFRYPSSAFDLRVDDLQITPGSATAVVGPSGSGKTTLLNLIAGILRPNSGQITIEDTKVTALPDAAKRKFRLKNIGMVFQDFELIEYLNVLDNILLPCRINTSLPLTVDLRQRAEELAALVGISSHLRKSVTKLSQGERQRVAICRALLTRPSLLLADEPTGNLDPVTSEQILQLLLKTVRDEGTTLVMVTHDHSLLHHFDHTVDFEQFLTAAAKAE